MRVSIIGQGYVGLTLAVNASLNGHRVVGFDSDERIILNLNNKISFIPGIQSISLQKVINSGSYMPTTDPEQINGSDIIVIAVPTPLNNLREPDLSFLKSAALQIARSVKNKALVINESTSYPGTLRNFIKPIISSSSHVKFLYASAPERIDPGNSEWNLRNTPRLVSGLTQEATQSALEFYNSICDKVEVVSSPEVAEAAKLIENTFRQVNIALANEFYTIANKLGFSSTEAISAAASKPFGFMPFYPSIGVGGHCIPIDPIYLSYSAKQIGVTAELIDRANKTNLSMVFHVVRDIEERLGRTLDGLKVQIAGISYKAGVSDLRESPALKLITELISAGAKVSWHDPLIDSYNNSVSSALSSDIDLGLVVSPHDEIDFSVWKNNHVLVFDLSANSKSYGWPKFF